MYHHDDEPNFSSFAAALRKGNKDAIVALNEGVLTPVRPQSAEEDYTAGEIANDFYVYPIKEKVQDAQFHILTYMGDTWGIGEPRLDDELFVGYTKHIMDRGGVISWDMPITHDGHIPEPFINQFSLLRRLR